MPPKFTKYITAVDILATSGDSPGPQIKTLIVLEIGGVAAMSCRRPFALRNLLRPSLVKVCDRS